MDNGNQWVILETNILGGELNIIQCVARDNESEARELYESYVRQNGDIGDEDKIEYNEYGHSNFTSICGYVTVKLFQPATDFDV